MITWREDWIDLYESPWNIIEKFKFLNQITRKDFNISQNQKIDDYIEQKIGVMLKKRTESSLENLSYRGVNDLHTLIFPKVRFCPICIRKGFHSYLHQFSILNICPFHQIKLYSRCPQCSIELDYTNRIDKRAPYTCKCKYNYIDRSELLKSIFLQKDLYEIPKYIKEWISSSLRTQGGIEIIPIYGEIPVNIFQMIENNTFQTTAFYISPYSFEINSQNEQSIDFNILFNDSKSIYASIGRYLRKACNFDGIVGINRYSRSHPSPPKITQQIASYLLWKMYVTMKNDVRTIDNGILKNPTIWDEPKFIAHRYNELLNILYLKLTNHKILTQDIQKYLLIIFSQILLFDFYRINISQKIYQPLISSNSQVGDWEFIKNDKFLGILLDFNVNKLFLIIERQ